MNIFKDFLEAYSLSKIYKIVLEYTLKCSQLISSSDNKKILLTTRNVRLDPGRYATKYYCSLFIAKIFLYIFYTCVNITSFPCGIFFHSLLDIEFEILLSGVINLRIDNVNVLSQNHYNNPENILSAK